MSDDYINIIPERPGFVPEEVGRQAALAYFRTIAPAADKITAEVSEQVEFVHCGQNFERIFCPSCGTPITMEVWQDWMDQDFRGRDKGFVLADHVLPCCGASASLHDLRYEWPQGFACFNLCAENSNIGKLSDEQCREFERLLGAKVRIVYEHL